MIIWVIAGLLGLATGLRIGWALVNKQSLVSTAMILALGSLGLVAALNWQPLTLLIDDVAHWPNIAMGFSQVALIACAAGSSVMITTVASGRKASTTRRLALAQYGIATLIAVVSLAMFFAEGKQPQMAPEEYLKNNLGSSWLPPLLYVLLALSLVSWAGIRHSSRSRRGRALFVFTVGILLIMLASGFFVVRAAGRSSIGVGTAATLLGCAMVVVAAGSLLPSVEDWFGARRELRTIQPILAELGRRHPDVGIGVRPRGPLVFRVAERMSLISDALFLEATVAANTRHTVDAAGTETGTAGRRGGSFSDEPGDRARSVDELDLSQVDAPQVPPREQARAIAEWIYAGRAGATRRGRKSFPGLGWLRQPESYSDREWILAIAQEYRALDSAASDTDD
ncbi:hypothetical protein [Mycolicibacterium arseniciresistens]|uniref:Uncharacterized protein n=1 Tax=Mycolicibacterium arseniciresistens TaxID=3062257 RepID=A0ABT8URG3_9MYCO|nr:hypothetical protein [Mycolicibacterium arseniciresistens]MDO3639761.1 hypothetical protein [Mycolicibacterium arseniciresistens]